MPTPIEISEFIQSSQIFFIDLTDKRPAIIRSIILKLHNKYHFTEISPVDIDLNEESALMLVGDGKNYENLDELLNIYNIGQKSLLNLNISNIDVRINDRNNCHDEFLSNNDIHSIRLSGRDGEVIVMKRGRDDYEVPCLFLMDGVAW